jgi:lipopolysaccharide/colanic/teichoic acid biosynthesis glycosyltransferase
MNLIIMHNNEKSATSGNGLLRFAVSSEPVNRIVFDALSGSFGRGGNQKVIYALPEEWGIEPRVTGATVITYTKDIPLCSKLPRETQRDSWLVVSNGQFATQISGELLDKVLADIEADVVIINVDPELLAYHEKVRLTTQGRLAGFRRLYCDFAESAVIPVDWPHHIFIKAEVRNQVLAAGVLNQSFSSFVRRCESDALRLRSIEIGGTVLDLGAREGLLGFLATSLGSLAGKHRIKNGKAHRQIRDKQAVTIPPSARLFGQVLFGQNISIGQNAIIVGPTIVGNDVKIERGAVIKASIVGHGVSVPRNHLVQDDVLIGARRRQERAERIRTGRITPSANTKVVCNNSFSNKLRTWPRFSYAGCFKRFVDIVVAVIVLILFAPIFPIIALVIKLTSSGPVFFKDIRQGMHGKAFNCLKFRTMLVGADKMQDTLRILNQADGPQFKMADDPRISAVGRFLRETYIDEVPQFLNVLLGHMSIVGPRPSPQSENTLCPSWRDARLSVRPGITGLWQVCRTRQPMKDFQEWIYYDIKYVRELSLKMDLWICWQTVGKMIKNFVSQF